MAHDARCVHEGALSAEREPAHEANSDTSPLAYEGLDAQEVVEVHTCENTLHLRDTRALSVSANVLSIRSNEPGLPNACTVDHAAVLKDHPAQVPQVEVVLMVLCPMHLPFTASTLEGLLELTSNTVRSKA